jgi:hypothetical protein
MATNFTLKREKAVHTTPAVYEMEREHKAERRKVMALEKELHEHERTDAAHAHPMHRSHEKSAPIPSMRK